MEPAVPTHEHGEDQIAARSNSSSDPSAKNAVLRFKWLDRLLPASHVLNVSFLLLADAKAGSTAFMDRSFQRRPVPLP